LPYSLGVTTTVTRLRRSLLGNAPGIDFETSLWESGSDIVVGIDEVGRGAWAGPLTVGAVVIPKDRRLYKIRDSKQLTETERNALVPRIKEWSVAWSVGHASAAECDAIGMSDAQRLATQRALKDLPLLPDHVLVDGPWDFVGTHDTTPIVKGDSISLSIAAASIIAKVTRDTMMRDLSDSLPWYGFESNKGYPCPRHKAALGLLGPSTVHRRSWAFMDKLPWSGIEGCDTDVEPLTLF
jgi:ribonuclease HII